MAPESDKVTAIGICSGGAVLIIHLPALVAENKVFPVALRNFLENGAHRWVGFHLGSDLHKLGLDDIKIDKSSVDDMGTIAAQYDYWPADTPRKDLAAMCMLLLGKNMNKDPGLRSAWKNDKRTIFTNDMLRYLTSDCSVPLEAFNVHLDRLQMTKQSEGAPPPPPQNAFGGPTASAPGTAAGGAGTTTPNAGFSIIPSVFQMDVFHDLQELRIKFGTTNSVCPFFLKAVKDHMLLYDPEDRELSIINNMERHGWDRRTAEVNFSTWVKGHQDQVRRRMPPPEDLYTSMKMIEDVFKDAVCTQGKGGPKKVFNKVRQDAWDKFLSNILNGHLTEDPEFPRYIKVGERGGMPVYNVLEHTSWLEVPCSIAHP